MSEFSVGSGVIRNLASQLFTRLFSNIGVRLLQVPILLHALGGDDYGRWLLLSTVPAWLTLANLGFGTVAGNQMLMSISSGDMQRANTVYAATWKAALLASSILLPIVLVGTLCLPVEKWIGLLPERALEARIGLCALCISVILSLFTDVISIRLRAGRRSHTAAYLLGIQLWVELLLIVCLLHWGTGFDMLGLANLASTIVCLLLTAWAGKGLLPTLRLNMRLDSRKEMVDLFRNGLHYQSLPVGHALILQGQLMVVHSILGSAAVAIFGTTRTMVRLSSQAAELVNHSVWPELSRLFGRHELNKTARLHRISVVSALSVSMLLSILLAVFGTYLYGYWTDRILHVDQRLLVCFLLSVPANTLWYTSSMVHLSCNRYEGLSRRYLIAACLSLVVCFLLTRTIGLQGAALSSLAADIWMIPFVWSVSLQLTGDRMDGLLHRIRDDIRWLVDRPFPGFRNR